MIDTLKIEVPLSSSLLKQLESVSVEHAIFDNKNSFLKYHFYRVPTNLGSYNRELNLLLKADVGKLYLEFSLPKFYNGHNIYLIYPQEIQLALQKLHQELLIRFSKFPPLSTWTLKRLDICYNWKFRVQSHAESTLSLLQSYNYPRHKKYLYDSSLMSVGKSYSLKFYLKNQEFYKNDYTTLKKFDADMANDLLKLSEGVLRFEVGLRSQFLESYFDIKSIPIEKLFTIDYNLLLNHFFKKFMSYGKGDFSTEDDALNKLFSRFKSQKALRLYQFFILWSKSSPNTRKVISKNLDRTTIYRNKRDLKIAGVGFLLPSEDLTLPTLSIPSDFSTN